MKKIATILAFTAISSTTQAACKWLWVDHDNNSLTPAIYKQVCDSAIRTPTIRMPSIRPIQPPSVPKIQVPGIPPIGTTRCINTRVYNQNTGRWESRRICS